MGFIDGIEKCGPKQSQWLAHANTFHPREFDIIDRMHVYHDPDVELYSNPKLELVLIRSRSSGSKLHLEFEGIHQLTLKEIFSHGTHSSQICGFVIEDFSQNGWEHIGIKVSDFEDDSITFHARRCRILEMSWGADLP